MTKKTEQYFKKNPEAKKVFSAGDRLFHTHGAAASSGLGEVQTINRPSEKTAEPEPGDDKGTGTGEPGANTGNQFQNLKK